MSEKNVHALSAKGVELLRSLTEHVNAIHHELGIAEVERASVAALTEKVAALQKFKDFVHRRLDEMGIPSHPEGEHSKHGCRIGDRLDIVKDLVENLPLVLERDRTQVCDSLAIIQKAMRSRAWMRDSRGSYSADDATFHREFGQALDELHKALEPLRNIATNWRYCPKTTAEVILARKSLGFEAISVAKQDAKWMAALDKIAGFPLCYDPLTTSTAPRGPTVEEWIEGLRQTIAEQTLRAEKAEKRLAEEQARHQAPTPSQPVAQVGIMKGDHTFITASTLAEIISFLHEQTPDTVRQHELAFVRMAGHSGNTVNLHRRPSEPGDQWINRCLGFFEAAQAAST